MPHADTIKGQASWSLQLVCWAFYIGQCAWLAGNAPTDLQAHRRTNIQAALHNRTARLQSKKITAWQWHELASCQSAKFIVLPLQRTLAVSKAPLAQEQQGLTFRLFDMIRQQMNCTRQQDHRMTMTWPCQLPTWPCQLPRCKAHCFALQPK